METKELTEYERIYEMYCGKTKEDEK